MPSSARSPRALGLAALPLLAAASTLLPPEPAQAEEVYGTRSEALVEQSHQIRMVLEHGLATLRVRRTVHNGALRHDQALFWIDVPPTAVATGLRTKGTLRGKDHWFDGDLLEAELAAARYEELTGIGGYYPKDPALLSWRSQQQLALQVFPVAPGTDKTVEYTFELPTVYEDGRDHVTLPAMGTDAHPARITLHPAHPRDQLFVDGEPVPAGSALVLDREHELSLARHDPPRIDASLASVSLGDDRVLMHYQVALAPRLSTVPRDARVVVVIDGSRSLGPREREAAVATASAYLEHFGGPRSKARAEVLVFDHEVRARHGAMVPVREALADLQHLTLPEANGSRLDAALTEAGDRLAKGPRGSRRILVLTDARTRASLAPARLEELSRRSGAIVHVGMIGFGDPFLERDDADPWAEVATATGGLVWQLANDPAAPRSESVALFEELARPVRLDHPRVLIPSQPDPSLDDQLLDGWLGEGQGVQTLEVVDAAVEHLRIEGQLWSEPVRETVFPDAAQGRRWSALVFGDELMYELSEEEMMPLAMRGGAVSPVTSYLAIEPGVRPSTEGLDHEEQAFGLAGIGFGGGGSGMGTIGAGQVMLRGPDPRQELLEDLVRSALDACGGQGLGAFVELETTSAEIVEIERLEVHGGRDPVLAPCLERGVWDTMLGDEFDDDRHTWIVELPQP